MAGPSVWRAGRCPPLMIGNPRAARLPRARTRPGELPPGFSLLPHFSQPASQSYILPDYRPPSNRPFSDTLVAKETGMRARSRTPSRRGGFTLIELLVVIA